MRTALDRRTTLLILASNDGNVDETARQTGVSDKTITRWRDQDREATAAAERNAVTLDAETGQEIPSPQIQPRLTPSERPEYPQRDERIALLGAIQARYAAKVLEMVDQVSSPQQAAVVMGIASDKLRDLVYPRGATMVNVDNRQQYLGSDVAQAAMQQYSQRSPRRKRK